MPALKFNSPYFGYLQLYIMKFLLAIPFLSALTSAAAISANVDYEGYQVVRLAVGEDVARINSLIENLSLSTWNGDAKENSAVDVVVPKDKVKEFERTTTDLQPQVMHPNLGASIAAESDFDVYRGKDLTVTPRLEQRVTVLSTNSRQRKLHLVQLLPCLF